MYRIGTKRGIAQCRNNPFGENLKKTNKETKKIIFFIVKNNLIIFVGEQTLMGGFSDVMKSIRAKYVRFELILHPYCSIVRCDGTVILLNDQIKCIALLEPPKHISSTSSFVLLFHLPRPYLYPFLEIHRSKAYLVAFQLHLFCTLRSYVAFPGI